MDFLIISSLILLFFCFLGLSWFAGSDAPYVATKMDLIRDVLKAAGIGKDKNFYELGSGDGRVNFLASKMGATSYGIEQSWLRVWYSRFNAYKLKLQNIYFYHGDIFQREYFPADIVYIFLLPVGIAKLEKKLQKELKKGAVVITQRYHFKNWKPFKQIGEFNLYRK